MTDSASHPEGDTTESLRAVPLSEWLRFALGARKWKDMTGDASWLYDKLEEAIPKVVALEEQLGTARQSLEAAAFEAKGYLNVVVKTRANHDVTLVSVGFIRRVAALAASPTGEEKKK